MSALQKWCASLVLTTIAVVISYLWFDRPIAFLAHNVFRQYEIFERLTRLPEPLVVIAVLALFGLGLYGLTGRALSRLQTVILLCGVSLIVTEAIKIQLKFVFGRTWPETWRGNPSLIHDGVYGFNPFHGGSAYGSFPSGHAAAICAVISVLWLCYPKYRWLYGLCVATVAIGLIGANYHFLSDVIAGGFLGISIGWIAVALWRTGSAPPRAP
jgi:membrane-associated phospholipid phosphatase